MRNTHHWAIAAIVFAALSVILSAVSMALTCTASAATVTHSLTWSDTSATLDGQGATHTATVRRDLGGTLTIDTSGKAGDVSYTTHESKTVTVTVTTSGSTDYTGQPIEPAVTVTFDGETLEPDDYTVTYSDNVQPGKATITVTGRGDYTGTATGSFRIGDTGSIDLGGDNRYDTSDNIADEAYPDGAEGVIVAVGTNYPDALAAVGLSGLLDWPIILTPTKALPSGTVDTIKGLGASKAIILGDSAAVSESVENTLIAMMGKSNVYRSYGKSRYQTCERLYEYGDTLGDWGKTCIIATGENYADALSISGYAFGEKAPMIFSNPDSGLTDRSKQIVSQGGFERIIIVGSTNAVPASVEKWCKSNTAATVTRLGGSNRYETSKKIAEYCIAQGYTADGACIATGKNFPDALSGGSLAGRNHSVILLADDGNMTSLEVLGAHTVTRLYYLGSTSAVTSKVRAKAEYLAGL